MANHFETIVAAIDFSETSQEALRTACALAVALGSRLHVFHATPDPLNEAWTVEAVGVDFRGIAEAWRTEAARRMADLALPVGLPAERVTRAVEVGVAHTAICDYAARHGADLIVLGTHGYGAVKHLLLGSVAERVVRHAPCPVVTVPRRADAA